MKSKKNRDYNRLKAVLADTRTSSKKLAKHLKVTESTVSRWCTNQVQPSLETMYEIAGFLKIDIRDLLVDNGKRDY